MSNAWRTSHREKAREVARKASLKYRLARLEAMRKKDRAIWRARHLEKPNENRDRKRKQRSLHGEEINAKRRTKRAENVELARAKERACYTAHIEKKRARERRWQKAHPWVSKIKSAHRRAQVCGAGGSHTAIEWIILCWASAWRCFYCRVALNEETAIQEHRVPIARGGSNDIENIVVSCATCNFRKGKLTDVEFLERREA